MEMSFNRILEHNTYLAERDKIRKETNSTQVPVLFNHAYYAPISSTPFFDRVFGVDYSVFKKMPGEKEQLEELKSQCSKARNHKFVTYMHVSF